MAANAPPGIPISPWILGAFGRLWTPWPALGNWALPIPVPGLAYEGQDAAGPLLVSKDRVGLFHCFKVTSFKPDKNFRFGNADLIKALGTTLNALKESGPLEKTLAPRLTAL